MNGYKLMVNGSVYFLSTVNEALDIIGPHRHVTGPDGQPASVLLAKVPGAVITFFRTIDNRQVRAAIRKGTVRGQVAGVLEVL